MIRNADKNLKSPDKTQVTQAKSNKINFAIMSAPVEICTTSESTLGRLNS